jgi:hypothetical protein
MNRSMNDLNQADTFILASVSHSTTDEVWL